jgi:hypothetical protein
VGCARVDAMHLGYVLLFILFAIRPVKRVKHWRKVNVYTVVAVAMQYLWHVLEPLVLGEGGYPSLRYALSVLGLHCYGRNNTLWTTPLAMNAGLLVLAALPLPHLDRLQAGHMPAELVANKYFLLRGLGERVSRFHRQLGMWMVYGALVWVGTSPPMVCGCVGV